MSFFQYEKCHRGLDDCTAITCLAEGDENTESPTSFICCGISNPESRELERDCYRLCFKNSVVDDISDNDEHDLVSLLHVISGALTYKEIMKTHDKIQEVVIK